MKILLLFCIALVSGAEYDGFQVTFPEYNNMPWTVSEAIQDNKWVKIDEDCDINVDVYSQPEDPKVLLYFDQNGNIGGIGICFIKDEMNRKALANNLTFNGEYYAKGRNFDKVNYFGKEMWCTQTLVVHPDKLAEGGRPDVLDKATDDVMEGIYFKNEYGDWLEVSKDECQVNEELRDAKCYKGMGKHYIYKTEEFCEKSHARFVLYNEGRLIGFVFAGFGTFTKNPNTKTYPEDFIAAAAKLVAPDAPQCVFDDINRLGMTTMHVFFKKGASAITCPAEDWKIKNCKKTPFDFIKKTWKKMFNN